MKMFNFLEEPKVEKNIEKKMFPQLFALSNEELLMIRGGGNETPCDAVCTGADGYGSSCSCHTTAQG